MNRDINVLYIGFNNIINPGLKHLHVNQYHDVNNVKEEYQVVIIDMILSPYEIDNIMDYLPTYGCFITKEVSEYYIHQEVMQRKQVKIIDTFDLSFLKSLPSRYFKEGRNYKFPIQDIGVNRSFKGVVTIEGKQYLLLNGDFSTKWKQTCFWKRGIEIDKRYPLSLWLEYLKDEDVHLQLFIEEIKKDSLGEICFEKIIEEDVLNKPLLIDDLPSDGIINISLRVTGNGLLKLGPLHIRQSRYEEGFFLPGDQRFNDYKRQEFFAYYDPGDMKPPLNVYFGNYHQDEGFEGLDMMKKMKSPFILLSDPRLDGGSFYIGSRQYESLLKSYIENKMNELHFNNKDLIFTGVSMGSYGALYYGCDFSPHAIIIGQPIANLGDVAKNETIFRPEVFPTSLDILRQNGIGELSLEAVNVLNDRLWNKFDKSPLDKTKIVCSYMKNDDYDKDAFNHLMTHSINKENMIYGKGVEGRHNDNKEAIFNWMIIQYEQIMKEDFNRED